MPNLCVILALLPPWHGGVQPLPNPARGLLEPAGLSYFLAGVICSKRIGGTGPDRYHEKYGYFRTQATDCEAHRPGWRRQRPPAIRQAATRMKPLPGVAVTLVNESAVIPYSAMVPGHLAADYTWDDITIYLVRLCQSAGVRFVSERVTALDPTGSARSRFAGRPFPGV